MTLASASGLLGVAFYLGSYALLQFGLLRGQSYIYAGMNLLAAVCVLLSLTEAWNLSSALIQTSWIVVSVVGMTRLWIIERNTQFSPDESKIIDRLIPAIRKDKARKFLDVGDWRDHQPGERVIVEGAPVEGLVYLAEGVVTVRKGGTAVATLHQGALLGEVTYLDGGPATADIETATEARLFHFHAIKLRELLARDEELRIALEQSVAGSLREKLRVTSDQLKAMNTG